jgi:hypothetical protein
VSEETYPSAIYSFPVVILGAASQALLRPRTEREPGPERG